MYGTVLLKTLEENLISNFIKLLLQLHPGASLGENPAMQKAPKAQSAKLIGWQFLAAALVILSQAI